MAVSILIDSVLYGRLTIPQVNFVHVNVVENISKYFGTEVWFYYIHEIKGFVFANESLLPISMFGLCMYVVFQMNGEIGKNRHPYLLTFLVSNLFVLSSVGHKE